MNIINKRTKNKKLFNVIGYFKLFKIKKFLINHSLFFANLLFLLIFFFYNIKSFKSLPSCLYGCDYYYQLGHIYHFYSGGAFMESSSIQGALPGYMPLYSFLVFLFGSILNLDPFHAQIYFSLVILFFSYLILYVFGLFLFEEKILANIFALLYVFPLNPVIKYTVFTKAILIPLVLLFLYLIIFKKKNLFISLGLGISTGLLGISHPVAFVGMVFILFYFFIFEILSKKFSKKDLKYYFVFLITSLPISLMYWFKPLFVYHGKMKYDRLHMDSPDFGRFDVKIRFLKETFTSYLSMTSFLSLLKSVFIVLGLYYLFKKFFRSKKQSDNIRFIFHFFIISLLLTFSYFITEPLLHQNLVNHYLRDFYLSFSIIMIMTLGIKYSYSKLKFFLNKMRKFFINNKNNKEEFKFNLLFKQANYFILIFLIFLISFLFNFINTVKHDNFWKNAKKDIVPKYMKSLQFYLLNSSNVDDVILTTKELGFAINSLTGRKLLTNRWAHQNNPYIDMPRRDLVAAIILYGNNTIDKLKLILKYNVSYIYWDYYWFNSEYNIINNNLVPYDPLIVFDNSYTRKILDYYGIKYLPSFFWIDPSHWYNYVRRYNILFILPNNYLNYTHPFSKDLDPFIYEVWSYKYKNKKIAVLYKINKSKIERYLLKYSNKTDNDIFKIVSNESNYYYLNNLNLLKYYYQ